MAMSTQPYEAVVAQSEQQIEIKAAPGDTFRGLISQMTKLNTGASGQPMPMVLEEWPGGRWFRDLGNGMGHLWGFVQSIKPPTLLEICGPLMMSHAVSNNVIIRLEPIPGGTRIKLRHQAAGSVPDEFRDGMPEGWELLLQSVKQMVEGK